MTCCDFSLQSDEGLSPEIRAMKGVYLLYLKIEELVDAEDLEDPLPQNARHMLLLLESPKRMGDLARDMLSQPSTVTALADKLEELGLVARRRDPSDRRAWLLELTEAGRAEHAETVSYAAELFRSVSGLDDDEIKVFATLMTKVRTTIEKSGLPKGPKA